VEAHELIVYACPLGPLARQLDQYFAASRAACGPNTAHRYMPHCTLTGFFHDEAASIEQYVGLLDAALERARPCKPAPVFAVREMLLREDFHGLLLNSPWLEALIADWAAGASSPTRREALRLKSDLHLSLAYGFPAEQHAPLAQLARELVDWRIPTDWELRFYERHPDKRWTCHAAWRL
jgi:ubiquitin-associated SH3 domain-containing protein